MYLGYEQDLDWKTPDAIETGTANRSNPEPDMGKLEMSLDRQRIQALARGALMQVDSQSGQSVVADRYFAPSFSEDPRTDFQVGFRGGRWVTREEAQMMFPEPPAPIAQLQRAQSAAENIVKLCTTA